MGRVEDEGPLAASSQGPPPISIPEHIAIVDTAVAKLKPPDDVVIKAYYLNWAPIEVLWKDTGLKSEANFKVVLKRARWRIAGFIECAELGVEVKFNKA